MAVEDEPLPRPQRAKTGDSGAEALSESVGPDG